MYIYIIHLYFQLQVQRQSVHLLEICLDGPYPGVQAKFILTRIKDSKEDYSRDTAMVLLQGREIDLNSNCGKELGVYSQGMEWGSEDRKLPRGNIRRISIEGSKGESTNMRQKPFTPLFSSIDCVSTLCQTSCTSPPPSAGSHLHALPSSTHAIISDSTLLTSSVPLLPTVSLHSIAGCRMPSLRHKSDTVTGPQIVFHYPQNRYHGLKTCLHLQPPYYMVFLILALSSPFPLFFLSSHLN